MEENTSYEEVIDSFHSTFQDKVELPGLLEKEWFKKAVGKFSFEIDSINYDEDLEEFDTKLNRYVIDTLGLMMKLSIRKENCQK